MRQTDFPVVVAIVGMSSCAGERGKAACVRIVLWGARGIAHICSLTSHKATVPEPRLSVRPSVYLRTAIVDKLL